MPLWRSDGGAWVPVDAAAKEHRLVREQVDHKKLKEAELPADVKRILGAQRLGGNR